MTDKQKTAVQWLIEQINSDCTNSTFVRPELIEKAFQMEREQIEIAYLTGLIYPNEIEPSEQAEQYFTDTYQSNER